MAENGQKWPLVSAAKQQEALVHDHLSTQQ